MPDELGKEELQRQLDDLHTAINTDGSLTAHQQFVHFARNGAHALADIEKLKRKLDEARTASLDAERRLRAVPESLLCDQRDPCSYDHTCRIHKALAELRQIAGGENG